MNITTNCDTVFLEQEKIHSFFPSVTPLCGLTLYARTKILSCITLIDLEQVENILEQNDARLPRQVLSVEELDHFKRYRYAKRRREWLGGRIAVKAALLQINRSEWMPEQLRRLSILPDEHGRPVANRMKDLAISLSHSSRFAVGLASRRTTCGIDLQKVSSKLEGLTERFTTPNELAVLAEFSVQEDLATRLTMLWAAKEALKKSLLHNQPAIFSGIELQHITCIRKNNYDFCCMVKEHNNQTAEIFHLSPYVLSLTGTDYA